MTSVEILADPFVEMSKAQRLLSYSLLSLITSKPLASAPTTGLNEDDEGDENKPKGHTNADGAWCWRDGCEGRFHPPLSIVDLDDKIL